jgi:hypothetical protein
MMKLQRFSLTLLLTLSANGLRADATDDLLFAIESGDISQAKTAITRGADLDISREEDGHNARSLAIAKLIESLEQNQQSGTIATILALGVPVSAAINSWPFTLAAAATAFSGYKVQSSSSTGLLEKLRNAKVGAYMIYASLLGTLGAAWYTKSPYVLASSVIGTAGAAALLYKSTLISKRYEIYSLVNPDDQLLEEDAQ